MPFELHELTSSSFDSPCWGLSRERSGMHWHRKMLEKQKIAGGGKGRGSEAAAASGAEAAPGAARPHVPIAAPGCSSTSLAPGGSGTDGLPTSGWHIAKAIAHGRGRENQPERFDCMQIKRSSSAFDEGKFLFALCRQYYI